MEAIKYFYPESKVGGFTHFDGTVAFYLKVNALLQDDMTALDLGCGRGAYLYSDDQASRFRAKLRNLKGKVAKVIGIDVDPVAAENPSIDEFYQLTIGQPWPIADHSVDLSISDMVLEHIDDPDFYFSELARVTKPGGHVCIRTVNTYGYVAMGAKLIPNRHHAKVTSRIQSDRKEEDVFPTLYKCNSVGKVRQLFKQHGFESVVYTHETEPTYFDSSTFLYFFAYLYQNWAPSMFRNTIFAFGTKSATK